MSFKISDTCVTHNTNSKNIANVKELYKELIDKISHFKTTDIVVKTWYSDKIKFELSCY